MPVAASSMTYVLNLISEQLFRMSAISSFDIASLFFLIIFGSLTFNLNFLGLTSIS